MLSQLTLRVATALVAFTCGVASAQTSPEIISPQTRPLSESPSLRVTGVDADVSIRSQSARTTLKIGLHNPTAGRIEGQLLIPTPVDAVVTSYHYDGLPSGGDAKLLPKDEARRVYEDIVRSMRDPALLEFAGLGAVRSSVFPIEAGATQTVTLTYETLCDAEGDRIDYVLPRSESVGYAVPWRIGVNIRTERPLSTAYSPSHGVNLNRIGPKEVRVRVTDDASTNPGSFRLSYLLESGDLTASLFAYPDAHPTVQGEIGSDGYFLMLTGLPASVIETHERAAIRREVTLVLDRSGSMQGPKLEQVREAALQVLAGLNDGEYFNVIVYNEIVDRFAERPVAKTAEAMARVRTYLEGVKARGGTNIHGALTESLRQPPTNETLPLVLFLTDGLPTVGETAEKRITEAVSGGNPHDRRVFTFGVGVDVNTPLLEDVAWETRGVATFVLPEEDVEVKVAGVFRKLAGPVLASPVLTVIDEHGAAAPGRVREVMPGRLPDLFDGDQLIVLGRYLGAEPIRFCLAGNLLGERRSFDFTFSLDEASRRNAFVPRLWASRRIGMLIDAIRELGAAGSNVPHGGAAADPRLAELVDEIVRLSTEFGILTEYTSFLARESTDMAAGLAPAREARDAQEAMQSFRRRAVETRMGLASVNQDENLQQWKSQTCLNIDNRYFDASMNVVRITTVQQVADLAFYKRGNDWIDARVVNAAWTGNERSIKLGTPEYVELVGTLTEQGRQGCLALGRVAVLVNGELVRVTDAE